LLLFLSFDLPLNFILVTLIYFWFTAEFNPFYTEYSFIYSFIFMELP
jgi:hypothetical protein